MRNFISISIALGVASLLPNASTAADNSDLQALRAQVQALEQQLKILARQIEIREEADAAARPTLPKISVTDRGVALSSTDGANAIKLRGLVQFDSRLFLHDADGLANNAFVLRRARLISEGTFAKNYSYQLLADFGGGSVTIFDANFALQLSPSAQLKFGKFKVPVGHEQLQAESWTFFNERSLVTNLVPNRDLGIQLGGELLGGRLNYAVGVFNGVADGANSTNSDFDEDKDIAGRLFASPFRNAPDSSLQGLSFGIAGSLGREKTVAGRTAGYRTDGQQLFFAYNSPVVADGPSWRVAPQLDFRRGSFGLMSEYVKSVVNVRPNATGSKTELSNQAWQLSAGYVLTGEDSSFNGVVPRTNFDLAARTWGAFEVVGRGAKLKIDGKAFPTFAAPGANAETATSYGIGLNWYLSKTALVKIDYYQTDFGFNSVAPAIPSAPVLRQDEKAFITRFQLGF